jgi:hypothetical protein
MAGHVYDIEELFAFGIADGGFAGLSRGAGIDNPNKRVEEGFAGRGK